MKIELSELVNPEGNTVSLEALNSSSTRWDGEVNICRQALQKLSYKIYYDNQNAITAVNISVHSVDIPIGVKTIRQNFRVFFIPLGNSKDFPGDATAVVYRKRSGNPGYNFGYPILAGRFLLRNETIIPDNLGLTLMDMGDGGRCETVSNKLVRE